MTYLEITRWTRHDRPRGWRERLWMEDVVAMLASPADATVAKSDLEGWAPATFIGDQRAKRYVEKVCGAGLDIDGDATIADIDRALGHLFGYLHSTPSATAEAPRWRVFIPFAATVSGADAELVIVALQRLAPGKVDASTKDPSRLWYLPRRGAGGYFEHARLDGDLFDPGPVVASERARLATRVAYDRVHRARPIPSTPTTLATRLCAPIANASKGSRHGTVNRVAYTLGGYVGAGMLTDGQATRALDEAIRGMDNEIQKTRFDEMVRTAHEALAAGKNDPVERPESPWKA